MLQVEMEDDALGKKNASCYSSRVLGDLFCHKFGRAVEVGRRVFLRWEMREGEGGAKRLSKVVHNWREVSP